MNEFEDFMNDRGEIRDMPFRIVHTKAIRNPTMERRIMEENRERQLYYVILVGAILMIAGLF